MRLPALLLLAPLFVASCSSSPGRSAEDAQATARADAGRVQFGVVVEDGARAATRTADYPHWDADGDWSVPSESIWTLEEPLVSCRVTKAVRAVDAQGFPAVEITLAAEDVGRFQALTRHAVARRLAVLVDGHVVLAPTLAGPLETARLQIAARFSEQDVQRLLEHLRPAPVGDAATAR